VIPMTLTRGCKQPFKHTFPQSGSSEAHSASVPHRFAPAIGSLRRPQDTYFSSSSHSIILEVVHYYNKYLTDVKTENAFPSIQTHPLNHHLYLSLYVFRAPYVLFVFPILYVTHDLRH
jgi:hypothetical protein